MEPEPALVVRRRTLLVLRVDLHQRRVHVQHHRTASPPARPHCGAGLGTRRPQHVEHIGVDGVEGPPDRRVRRHRAEQRRLITQRRHVRNATSASGEHHRHLRQHPAPIMNRRTLTGPRDRCRIGRRQPDPISQLAEHVGTHQLRRRAVAAGHPQPFHRRCSVHLASALQVQESDRSATSESLTWRALPRMGGPQLTRPRERSGLISGVEPVQRGLSGLHRRIASPCQGEGRGFESRRPLHTKALVKPTFLGRPGLSTFGPFDGIVNQSTKTVYEDRGAGSVSLSRDDPLMAAGPVRERASASAAGDDLRNHGGRGRAEPG